MTKQVDPGAGPTQAKDTYENTWGQMPKTSEDAYEVDARFAAIRARQVKRLQDRAWLFAALACALTTWALVAISYLR